MTRTDNIAFEYIVIDDIQKIYDYDIYSVTLKLKSSKHSDIHAIRNAFRKKHIFKGNYYLHPLTVNEGIICNIYIESILFGDGDIVHPNMHIEDYDVKNNRCNINIIIDITDILDHMLLLQ
eukprot:Pompholyxophrys_sp_v1_NODE_4_length_15125_cov_6.573656.p14 type:complete len:121 gc:universal NODE_4_length_15125_cov_6.573656:589-951(+)